MLLCFLCIAFWSLPCAKGQRSQGMKAYKAQNYELAIKAFEKHSGLKKDPQALMAYGNALLYMQQPSNSISAFQQAIVAKSRDKTLNKSMGDAFFMLSKYEEATNYYKRYLLTSKPYSPEWNEVSKKLKQCGFAIQHSKQTNDAFVEHLPRSINSSSNEIRPIQSPTNPFRFYFSSDKNGYLDSKSTPANQIQQQYDILYADLVEGSWSIVLPIGRGINTNNDEILFDFDANGQVAFFSRGIQKSNKRLLVDSFQLESGVSDFLEVDFPFDLNKGDKDLRFFNDSLIVFASSRFEGYGGLDLFYAYKEGSKWTAPVNFGKEINSKHDEQSPVLSKSGGRLFFSSNRYSSFGGYDIFHSSFSQSKWSSPKNIGIPINTPSDETDIELSSDGKYIIFSSDRIGSYGKKDIYIAYLKDQIDEQLDYVEMPIFIARDSAIIMSEEVSVVKRNINLRPIYFKDNNDLFNKENDIILNRLVEVLSIYPNMQIILASHFTPEGFQDYELYLSLKRGELICEYLTNRGLDPNRIHLIGCGSSYPMVQNFINGQQYNQAQKLNKRIDFFLVDYDEDNFNVVNEKPSVDEKYIDFEGNSFSSRLKGITFRVQFLRSNQMYKGEMYGIHSDILIEKNCQDSWHYYTSGIVNTLEQAVSIEQKFKKQYIENTKIIPYYNGKRLSLDEVEELSDIYPELKKWLEL